MELADNCPTCATACIGIMKAHLLHTVAQWSRLEFYGKPSERFILMPRYAAASGHRILPHPCINAWCLCRLPCSIPTLFARNVALLALGQLEYPARIQRDKGGCMSVLASYLFQVINFVYTESTPVKGKFCPFNVPQYVWQAKYLACHLVEH